MKSKSFRVAVVVGSTRPRRICPEISEWVRATAQAGSNLCFELVDLLEIGLPFLDEPEIAARGSYSQEHTKRWSDLVSAYDAFVFVFPQYNWGYPGVLKNALDFLYEEWRNKPAALVTYGSHGGRRASEQMQVVLQGLHMRNTSTNPALTTNETLMKPDGTFIAIAAALSPCVQQIQAMEAELAVMLARSG